MSACHAKEPRPKETKASPTPTKRSIKMTPRVEEMLQTQLEAFRKKFGREPGPGDPVFFDPNADEPTPLDIEDDVLAAMQQADLPPEFAYAYRKTGLLGLATNKDAWPPEHVKEWEDAVDEYRAIQAAEERTDRPDPSQWSTKIPDLLLSPFNRDDYNQVRECLDAIAPIEARGMTLGARIELAAALLSMACQHGYDAAEDLGDQGDGPEMFEQTEGIVLRRAREIYSQGGG